MTDTKKTLQELNNIIDFLKTKVDSSTGFTGTEKVDWEKRITDLRTNSESFELSLKGIENIGSYFADEKVKLETAKVKAEEDKTKAEEELQTLRTQIADKLTPQLVAELTKYPNLQSALDEIKSKGVNYVVDLSSINTKLEELSKKNPSNQTPSWVGYTILAMGAITMLFVFYQTLSKKNKQEKSFEIDE